MDAILFKTRAAAVALHLIEDSKQHDHAMLNLEEAFMTTVPCRAREDYSAVTLKE